MKNRYALRGPAPFSEDRYERAAGLFAAYFRRQCGWRDMLRLVVLETRMQPTDYLVGKRIKRDHLEVIGVVCDGFAIVDASAGKPDFALPHGTALSVAQYQF